MSKKIDYETWHADFNIKVMSHPTNGRYIVATEDMVETSIILKDLPYTWAVDHSSKNFVCQQCFLEVPIETQRDRDTDTPDVSTTNDKKKKNKKSDANPSSPIKKKVKVDRKTPDISQEQEQEQQQQDDEDEVLEDVVGEEEEEESEDEEEKVPLAGEVFLMCDDCCFVGYCSEACKQKDYNQHKYECMMFQKLDIGEYSTSLLSEIKLLIRTLSRKWLEADIQKGNQESCYQLYKQYESSVIPQENGLRYSDYDQLVSNINSFCPTLKESLLYWICNPVLKLARRHVGKKEDEVDLLNVLLRNRCNAFYIQGRPKHGGNGESRGCGVYVRNSFFNHSCNPNVNYWVVDNTLEVECSLMRDVKKGDELCISYIDTAATLKERRDKLLEGYLFTCQCDKCVCEESGAVFQVPESKQSKVVDNNVDQSQLVDGADSSSIYDKVEEQPVVSLVKN